MDGSGQDNDAAAGEQPRPPPAFTLDHVISRHVLFNSVQARVNDISRYAPDDGLSSRGDTDGFGQNNDAEAGEQTHPLPAGRPVLVASPSEYGFFDDVVLLVPQHENGYLIGVRSRRDEGNGHRHVNGYGDDAYRGGGFGAVPASDDEIARLEKATVGDTREAECVVCMESLEEGDEIRKMPCSHGFHESCIFKWLRVSRLCPHCRFAMRAEDDDNRYEDNVTAPAHGDEDEDNDEAT